MQQNITSSDFIDQGKLFDLLQEERINKNDIKINSTVVIWLQKDKVKTGKEVKQGDTIST